MRPLFKRIWMFGAALCLLLVVAVGSAIVYVNSAAFRDKLIARIDEAIAGRIEMARLRIRVTPLSGRLVLENLRAIDPSGETVAAIDEVDLCVRWAALLRRTLHLSHLRIERPVVSGTFDADDRLILRDALTPVSDPVPPPPSSPAAEAPAFGLTLDALEIHNGRITVERPAMGLTGAADAIRIVGSGDLRRRSATLALTVGQLQVQTHDGVRSLQEISLTAEHDPSADLPLALVLRTPRSWISAGGRLAWDPERPTVALTCELGIDLSEAQSWLPVDLGLWGRVESRIEANGFWADPAVALELVWSDGGVWGVDFQRLGLDLRLQERRVALDRLDLQSVWGEADLQADLDLRSLFPESLIHRTGDIGDLAFDIDLHVHRLLPGRMPALDFPWGGTWQGRARLAGKGVPGRQGAGDARVEIGVRGLQISAPAEMVSGDWKATAGWADGRVMLSESDIALGDHRLAVQGWVDLERSRLEAAGHVHLPSISDMGAVLGTALPAGQAALEFRCHGDLARPEAHAVLLATDLAWDETVLGRLLVEADLDADGGLHFPRLVLENQGSYLEGVGRMALREPDGSLHADPPLTVVLNLDSLELVHFLPQSNANARLAGQLKVGGSVRDPVAELTLAPGSVHWQTLSPQVAGVLHWQAGGLRIDGMRFFTDRSVVRLDGSVQIMDPNTGQWTTDPEVDVELSGDPIGLADGFEGWAGDIALRAHAKGRVSQLEGGFRLDGHALDLGVQQLDMLVLEGRLTPGIVHMDTLHIALAPGADVAASGWFGFDQRFEAAVNVSGLDLRHIDLLGPEAPLQGRLELAVTAGGTVSHPEAVGRLRLRDPLLAGQPWEDFHARVRLHQNQLHLDADLTFRLAANAGLENGAFDVDAVFDRTELAPYLALLGDLPWSGHLSGRVRAAGNWHAPADARVDVSLTDTHLRHQGIDLLHIEALSLGLSDGVLDLPPTRLAWLEVGELTVSAGGDLERDLAVAVKGMLPLSVLDPFADAITEARGMMHIDARAGGPVSALTWQAEVVFEQIGFLLPDLDQTVNDLGGRISFSPERITLSNLAGTLDNGWFVIDGQLGLIDFQPAQGRLGVTLQALPLQIPGTMDVRIAGDLVLTGGIHGSRLEGNLVVLEGAYYKDLNLNLLSAVTQTHRADPVPATDPPPEWLSAIDLDVAVTHRYPFLVDNNVARLEIMPDLRISGTAARPLLDGRARVAEGEVYFRRRAFTVTRGVVDFIHPYRIEPTLDIVAETRIRQWRIILEATGPPDNLVIALHSDPPESDSNILSLILLGRTSSELGAGGGGATTGQMLASLVESAWGEDIRRGVGVDILEVETGAPDPMENSDRIQVTVGKRLSPRLTVKYAVEAGSGETVQKAISEYRLLEHVLASGFQDTAGVYGGELLFRFEFR